jgi:hypothetical protein
LARVATPVFMMRKAKVIASFGDDRKVLFAK